MTSVQDALKPFQGDPPDVLTNALRIPMRALESRPMSTFGEVFTRVLLFIWNNLIPSVIRQYLLRRFNQFLSRRSQLRFRLKDNHKIKFFQTHLVDKEVLTVDGIKLKCTHVWPRTGDENEDHNVPKPVCIMRTVYSRKFDFPIARILAERGFHVILQDTRGAFESEGVRSLGELEARDAGCTMRWLSEQEWCDGRIFLIGISIGGYTTWASASGLLRSQHKHPLEELEGRTKIRKPIRIVAAFPLFSSSDILRRGMFVDLDEARPDPILKLDLATRYQIFMWNLAHPGKVFGSHSLWVLMTAIFWQIQTERPTFLKRQMHLPLSEVDIAVCDEQPNPRLPLVLNPEDDFWKQLSYADSPYEIGKGVPVGDVEDAEPPALFFASGWFDLFREQTMNDFQRAMAGREEARRRGERGNEHIYLMMGPWTHFGAETFFGPVMRETIRVLDHVFADLGHESHNEDPLSKQARVIAFCFGAGGFFFHRLPAYKKAALLLNPNNPFNIENDSNHCWRHYDCWPPRTSCPVYFALQPRGQLKLSTASLEPLVEGSDSLVWDPSNPTPTLGGATFNAFTAGPQDNRPLEARPDTLVYTSVPNMSREAVEFAGCVKVRVWVYSTAQSADIYARLTIVDPKNGESISLCDGIRRITIVPREGESGTNNTSIISNVEDYERDWPRLFEVNLGNFCGSIEPKWRIRIMLAGGSFPQFSRNLGYGEDLRTATKFTKVKHRISFKEFDQYSELELPIIGGADVAAKAFKGMAN